MEVKLILRIFERKFGTGYPLAKCRGAHLPPVLPQTDDQNAIGLLDAIALPCVAKKQLRGPFNPGLLVGVRQLATMRRTTKEIMCRINNAIVVCRTCGETHVVI